MSFLGYPAALLLGFAGRRALEHYTSPSRVRPPLPRHIIAVGAVADATLVALLSSFFADSWAAGLACLLVAVYVHALVAAAGAWVTNGYFLPPPLLPYVRAGLLAATVTFCGLAINSYIAEAGATSLMWLALGCLPPICALVARGVSEEQAQHGVQSIASSALFPVYRYDGATGQMKEANAAPASLFAALALAHTWGVAVSCLISPAAIGVVVMCLSQAAAVIAGSEWLTRSLVAFDRAMDTLAGIGRRAGHPSLSTTVVVSVLGRSWAHAGLAAELEAGGDGPPPPGAEATGGAALAAAARAALGGAVQPTPTLAAARTEYALIVADAWWLLRGGAAAAVAHAYAAPAPRPALRSRPPLLDAAEVDAACGCSGGAPANRLTVALIDLVSAGEAVDAAADSAGRVLAGVAYGVISRAGEMAEAERAEWELFLGWAMLPANAPRIDPHVAGIDGLGARLRAAPSVEDAARWPAACGAAVRELRRMFDADREALADSERQRARDAGVRLVVRVCTASVWAIVCAPA